MKYFEKQSMSENIKALIVSLYYHNTPALTFVLHILPHKSILGQNFKVIT